MPPTPLVAPETSAESAAPKKYFAHRNILHNGTSIAVGAVLPDNIPADSLKRLIQEKSIGESPLQETKVTTTPGKSKA